MAAFLGHAISMSEIASTGITSEHVFHTKQLLRTHLQSQRCTFMTLLRSSSQKMQCHSFHNSSASACLWNSQPCEVQDSYRHSARETKLDVQTSSFSWKGAWIFSMLWSQNKVAMYAHGIAREIMPEPMHSWKYFLHSVGRRSVNEKSWNGGPAIHVEFRCNFGIFSIR